MEEAENPSKRKGRKPGEKGRNFCLTWISQTSLFDLLKTLKLLSTLISIYRSCKRFEYKGKVVQTSVQCSAYSLVSCFHFAEEFNISINCTCNVFRNILTRFLKIIFLDWDLQRYVQHNSWHEQNEEIALQFLRTGFYFTNGTCAKSWLGIFN